VMISHAAYPVVTSDRVPASLSQLWITQILRKRIGYQNMIVSDDLEMGGVLSAAPVGKAAVEFIRAGGDLCLICHREDRITEAYDELSKQVEQDSKFTKRVAESLRRVLGFKRKSAKTLRRVKLASAATLGKLSRKLWEFGEQVRVDALVRAERAGNGKVRRQQA